MARDLWVQFGVARSVRKDLHRVHRWLRRVATPNASRFVRLYVTSQTGLCYENELSIAHFVRPPEAARKQLKRVEIIVAVEPLVPSLTGTEWSHAVQAAVCREYARYERWEQGQADDENGVELRAKELWTAYHGTL